MQSVSTPFRDMATASYQHPLGRLRISWLRRLNTGSSYAEVDTSTVDGSDLVQGLSSIISPVDLFQFFIEDERLLKLKVQRDVLEPMGSISYAYLDAILENTDNRFTYDVNSTIGTAILPKRPIIAQLGFTINSIGKTINTFKGLLDRRPEEDKANAVIYLTAFDYMSYLNEYKLESSIKQNKRTDELIVDILTEAGFNNTQYDLDAGLNTIDFAWFEKGQTAGQVIRMLCESEEAYFFQDEDGILKFRTRRAFNSSPYNTVQHTIDKSDIIEFSDVSSNEIINRCVVTAYPRTQGEITEMWSSDGTISVQPGASLPVWADFQNPAISFVDPVEGIDYIANTAEDGSGSDISDDITITLTGFTTSAKLIITNANASVAYLNTLQLRGTPAVEGTPIEEIYEDASSISKFGEIHEYVIRNDFIDDKAFAYYLARALVSKYSGLSRKIRVVVASVPQIQLLDKVSVQDTDTNTYTSYRVMGIVNSMNGPSLTTQLTLREITSFESDQEATVDTSVVDGSDVVGV